MAKKKQVALFIFILLVLLVMIVFYYQYKNDQPVKIRNLDSLVIPQTELPTEKTKLSTLDDIQNDKKKREMDEYIQPTYFHLGFSGNSPVSQSSQSSDIRKAKSNPSGFSSNSSASNSASSSHSPSSYSPSSLSSSPSSSSSSSPRPTSPRPTLTTSTKPDSTPLFGVYRSNNKTPYPTQSALKDNYKAQIYGDQKIQNNGAFIVRNLEPITFHDLQIPINSIFYGRATFIGNRVNVLFTKVKTPAGDQNIRFIIRDNDHIEGIYFKSALDEVVDDTQDATNTYVTPSKSIDLINRLAQGGMTRTKELLQKTRTLNLDEGYAVFLVPYTEIK